MWPAILFLSTWILVMLLQRKLHRLCLTIIQTLCRQSSIAFYFYYVFFLPGILLHEGSHWISARLLGVRVGRFSVMPQRTDRHTIRFGAVEIEHVDPFRMMILGAAPLLVGTMLISLIVHYMLGLKQIFEIDSHDLWLSMWKTIGQVDPKAHMCPWIYLIFVISNTMMPSASDRKAWIPGILLLLGIAVVATSLDLFYPLVDLFRPWLRRAATMLGIVFGFTIVIDGMVIIGLEMIRVGLKRILPYRGKPFQ